MRPNPSRTFFKQKLSEKRPRRMGAWVPCGARQVDHQYAHAKLGTDLRLGSLYQKGEPMLVDVIFEKQYSAMVTVEVPDDATEEQSEDAAKQKLQESDWTEDHNGVLKIVFEPSL
jgi:hypothetical protein